MAFSQRNNLAQELHDGIAQDLVGLGYSLDLLLAAPDTPTQTRVDIRTLRFTLTEILEKVRNEIHQLRNDSPATLAQNIQESAESICQEFSWNFQIDEVRVSGNSDAGYQILQIAREILRNIAAHSQGREVSVILRNSDEILQLEICDDGIGGAVEIPNHYGIVGAQDRAVNLGARFTIDSSDSGTRICLHIPMENLPSL